MKIPAPSWYSQLQSDAQHVSHTTRLASLLFRRTLLHLRLSVKTVSNFGLLRSLFVVPMLIARRLGAATQALWSLIEEAATSLIGWTGDGPIAHAGQVVRAVFFAPSRMTARAIETVRRIACRLALGCHAQYRKLSEFGFLNVLALTPFLFVRMVQGATLMVWRRSAKTLVWVGHGLWAACSYGVAAVCSLPRILPNRKLWLRRPTVWIRTAKRATVNTVNVVRIIAIPLPNFDRMTGAFRQNTAWILVTVTGTAGLMLMLYLQMSSQPASADGNVSHQPALVAVGSPEKNQIPLAGRRTAILPVESTIESRGLDPFADDASLPETAGLQHEPEFNVQPKFDEQEPPLESLSPTLELDIDLFASTYGMDDASSFLEDRFVETSKPPTPASADLFSALDDIDDGWQQFRVSTGQTSGSPAFDRTLLDLPDLIVPASKIDKPLVDVQAGPKEIDVTVSRHSPSTAVIHQPMNYRIVVSNRGRETVDRVVIEEHVPAGLSVVKTFPPGKLQAGMLVWNLRDLKPGSEKQLDVHVLPRVAGTMTISVKIRSVVAVTSQTQVSELPLHLEVSAPRGVSSGQQCLVHFKVTNKGALPLDDVVIRTVLPVGLSHVKGRNLDYHIESLAPGETQTAKLTTHAATIGMAVLSTDLIVGGTTMKTVTVHVAIRKTGQSRQLRRKQTPGTFQRCDCLP